MQLEKSSQRRAQSREWSGTVPTAVDVRVLGLVVATAGLAASVNIPYGGVPFAIVAFVLLAAGGVGVHLLGERQLRRITDGLVERWVDAGGDVESVTRSSDGMRTEWTVRTPRGDVVVGGVALAPITKLSIEWQGMEDTMDAADAEENLDRLADGLYTEIFEIGSATQRA
ncbi:hypothetical protein [Halopiger xanaduensis]|uniref:Uncharacterized protein n=1 Tax=Halopiger xanaduensis (strain DSM 18323 / JCM 14033 / SH-6) TaxID=797210 RepID=F8D8Q4_HALXS|nr:hypothetical protein [Halopiger xanaduensis]AEH36813.1 hypothetical protein Halxa_2188 [Halopiger xanaduensis SH-6]